MRSCSSDVQPTRQITKHLTDYQITYDLLLGLLPLDGLQLVYVEVFNRYGKLVSVSAIPVIVQGVCY